MEEELSIMPNKQNKEQWNALAARFKSMCYGCGGNIYPAQPIMNNRTYQVSMHLGCYIKHIKGEDD